jgi:2'-5' RNA ligase
MAGSTINSSNGNGLATTRAVLPRSGLVLPAGVRSVEPKQRTRVSLTNRRTDTRLTRRGVSNREVSSELGGEIGTSGLKQYGGFVLEEWLPKLRGRYGAWAYREMMDNSPTAGGIIFAIKSLARQVEFSVEDDVPISGQDLGFCESCMHDMSHTWLDFISEALSMCGYGWALHEEVYKYRRGGEPLPTILDDFDVNIEGDVRSEDVDPVPPSSQYSDGRIGWRKLPIRAQETLMRWWFRGYAGLRAMEQIDWHGGRHIIPIGKAMLFRTETTRQNPEGRSLLRNAWTSYYAIQNIQAIEAIGIERDLAGIPVAAPPPGVDLLAPENSELLEIAKDMVRDIRRDEDEGVVKPNSEWTLELMNTGGSRQLDTDEVIRRYENRMLTSVLADFLSIGQDGMGSYAMVDVKAELFGVAIDAILDLMCEVVNRYGFPRLLALNGMHPKKMPKLRHSSAGRIDLRLVGEFLTNISLAGAQVPWSKGLIEHLFRAGALPEPEWDDLMPPAQPSPTAHDSQWRPAWGNEDGPGQQPPKQLEEKTPGRSADEPRTPAKPTERDHIKKAESHTGAMVALYPDQEVARRIAQTGGEDPAELHLTLAYLGPAADLQDPDRLADVVRGIAASTAPLEGSIQGAGVFNATQDGRCLYASPDVPGLPHARHHLVDHLGRAGYTVSSEHGFTPHITLGYEQPTREIPELPALPLRFTHMSLVRAGQREDFPLTGEPLAKAETGVLDLSQELAQRHGVLSSQLERDMDSALGELGAHAARAYASLDQTKRRNPDQAAGAVVARTGVNRWVGERLRPVLAVHAGRVAQDTQRLVRGQLGADARIDERALARMRQSSGRHLRVRDLEPQVRDAVHGAIADGLAAGENHTQVAARIRENVPRGRFRLAGAKWRSGLIARTETSNLQRQASVEAYHATGKVSRVQALGNGGDGAPRDGEIIPIDEAREAAALQHPDSTQSFSPVLD